MKWIKYVVLASLVFTLTFSVGYYYQSKPTNVPIIDNTPMEVWTLDTKTNKVSLIDPGFIRTDTPVTPPVVAPVTQSVWSFLLSNIITILAVPIATGLSALAAALLATILKKFNIQINTAQQAAITDAATTGIHSAEAWAANKATTPSANDKLNFAIQATKSLLSTDVAKGVTDVTIAHYIEEAVYKTFNMVDPNDVVPVVTPPKA